MVAPLAVIAGLAGRYGAKKAIKGLASKAQKKAAKDQIKATKEINSIPKPTGASKVKADKARDKFMDKLNKAEPGPKNKQNFKEKGTKLERKHKCKDIRKAEVLMGVRLKDTQELKDNGRYR